MASWNPLLHPRDRKGRFIRKFGFIKFLDSFSGSWGYGQAVGVTGNSQSPVLTIKPIKDLKGTPTGKPEFDLPASKVYVAATPKAHLTIASDSAKKVGPQAGSNPGGLYKIPTTSPDADAPPTVNPASMKTMPTPAKDIAVGDVVFSNGTPYKITAAETTADLTTLTYGEKWVGDSWEKLDTNSSFATGKAASDATVPKGVVGEPVVSVTPPLPPTEGYTASTVSFAGPWALKPGMAVRLGPASDKTLKLVQQLEHDPYEGTLTVTFGDSWTPEAGWHPTPPQSMTFNEDTSTVFPYASNWTEGSVTLSAAPATAAPATAKGKKVDPKVKDLFETPITDGIPTTVSVDGVSITKVSDDYYMMKSEVGGTLTLESPDAIGIMRALDSGGFPAEGDTEPFHGARAPKVANAWEHPKTGEKRFYINNWRSFMPGISADYKGKAWFSEDGVLTIDNYFGPDSSSLAKALVLKALDDYGLLPGEGGGEQGGDQVPEAAPSSDTYYVKKAKTLAHGRNEALANALYTEAGVYVPEVDFNAEDSNIYSKVVAGSHDMSEKLSDPEWAKSVQDDFAIDAWLANWDVFGMTNDNILTDAETGAPVRIDNGGALLYRAQGKPKGADFGPSVPELDTYRSGKKSAVFGKSMSKESELDGAQRVLAITPGRIEELVAEHNLKPSLADTLKARRKYIADYYGLPLPETMNASGAEQQTSAPLVDPLDDVNGNKMSRDWSKAYDSLFQLSMMAEPGDLIKTAAGVHTLGREGDVNEQLAVFMAEGGPFQIRKEKMADRLPHGAVVDIKSPAGIEEFLTARWQRGDRIVLEGTLLDVEGVNRTAGLLLVSAPGENNTFALNAHTLPGDTATVVRWDPPVSEDTPAPAPSVKTGMAVETEKELKADLVQPLPDNGPPVEKPKVQTDGIGDPTPKSDVKTMQLGDNTVASTGDVVTHKNGSTFLFVKPKGPYAVVTDPNSDDPEKQYLKKASTLLQPGKEPDAVQPKAAPKSQNGIVPEVGLVATAKDGSVGPITMVSPDGKFVYIQLPDGKKKRKSTGAVTIEAPGSAPEAVNPDIVAPGTPSPGTGGIPGHHYGNSAGVENPFPKDAALLTPESAVDSKGYLAVVNANGDIDFEKWANQPLSSIVGYSPKDGTFPALQMTATAPMSTDAIPEGMNLKIGYGGHQLLVRSAWPPADGKIVGYSPTEQKWYSVPVNPETKVLVSASFGFGDVVPDDIPDDQSLISKIVPPDPPVGLDGEFYTVPQILSKMGDYGWISPDGVSWTKVTVSPNGTWLNPTDGYGPAIKDTVSTSAHTYQFMPDEMAWQTLAPSAPTLVPAGDDEVLVEVMSPSTSLNNPDHVLLTDFTFNADKETLSYWDGTELAYDDAMVLMAEPVPAGQTAYLVPGSPDMYTVDAKGTIWLQNTDWPSSVPALPEGAKEVNLKSKMLKGVAVVDHSIDPDTEGFTDDAKTPFIDYPVGTEYLWAPPSGSSKIHYKVTSAPKPVEGNPNKLTFTVDTKHSFEGVWSEGGSSQQIVDIDGSLGDSDGTFFKLKLPKADDIAVTSMDAVPSGPDLNAPPPTEGWGAFPSIEALHMPAGAVWGLKNATTGKVSYYSKVMADPVVLSNGEVELSVSNWDEFNNVWLAPSPMKFEPDHKWQYGWEVSLADTASPPTTAPLPAVLADITDPSEVVAGDYLVRSMQSGAKLYKRIKSVDHENKVFTYDDAWKIPSGGGPADAVPWPAPGNKAVTFASALALHQVGKTGEAPDLPKDFGSGVDTTLKTDMITDELNPGDWVYSEDSDGNKALYQVLKVSEEVDGPESESGWTYKKFYTKPAGVGDWALHEFDHGSFPKLTTLNGVYQSTAAPETVTPPPLAPSPLWKPAVEGQLASSVPAGTMVNYQGHIFKVTAEKTALGNVKALTWSDTNMAWIDQDAELSYFNSTWKLYNPSAPSAPQSTNTPSETLTAPLPTPSAPETPTSIPGYTLPTQDEIVAWGGTLTKNGHIPYPGMNVSGKGPMIGKVVKVNADKTKAVVLTSDGKKTTRLIAALKSNTAANYAATLGPVEPVDIPEGMAIPYDPPKKVFADAFAEADVALLPKVKGLANMHPGIRHGVTYVKGAVSPSGKKYARAHFTMTQEQREKFLHMLTVGDPAAGPKGAWGPGLVKPLSQLQPGDAVSLRNSNSQGEWVIDKSASKPTHKMVSLEGGVYTFESLAAPGQKITTPFTKKVSASTGNEYTAAVSIWDPEAPAAPPPSTSGFPVLSANAEAKGWQKVTSPVGGYVKGNSSKLLAEPGHSGPSQSSITSGGVGARMTMADGTVIEVTDPTSGYKSTQGIVVISVPEGGDPVASYGAAMASLGMDYTPVTKESVKAQVRPILKNMVELHIAKVDSTEMYGTGGQKMSDEEIFKRVGAAVGVPDVGWDDVRVTMSTDQGKTEFFWSDRVRDAISAQNTKWSLLIRGGGTHTGTSGESIASNFFYGANDSTARRYLGLQPSNSGTGISNPDDVKANAGHGSFMSSSSKGGLYEFPPTNSAGMGGGGYTVYHQPAALFARIADYRPGTGDAYGTGGNHTSHNNFNDGKKANALKFVASGAYNSRDLWISGGMPTESITYIVVNELNSRKAAIKTLHDRGIFEYGGRKIEDIIRLRSEMNSTYKTPDAAMAEVPPYIPPPTVGFADLPDDAPVAEEAV